MEEVCGGDAKGSATNPGVTVETETVAIRAGPYLGAKEGGRHNVIRESVRTAVRRLGEVVWGPGCRPYFRMLMPVTWRGNLLFLRDGPGDFGAGPGGRQVRPRLGSRRLRRGRGRASGR